MFTVDPVTNSTSHLVINANYGLGESVVSGKSDPDTYFVSRDPRAWYIDENNYREALNLDMITYGKKKTKIVETGQYMAHLMCVFIICNIIFVYI